MSWFSKAASWVGKNVGTIAQVALPVVGFAAGLLVPSVGTAIGKLADKIGNKVSDITGIGDGKPGILGIGDGLPGLLGIGTGKNKEELIKAAVSRMKELLEKKDPSPAERAELEDVKKTASQSDEGAELARKAKEAASKDMKKEGINPMLLVGGGLLALFAFRK